MAVTKYIIIRHLELWSSCNHIEPTCIFSRFRYPPGGNNILGRRCDEDGISWWQPTASYHCKFFSLSWDIAFPTRLHMCPAKTQISLHSHTVWSESLLSILRCFWILGYPQIALQRFWSDCTSMQADLSLCWEHMQSTGWFQRNTFLVE